MVAGDSPRRARSSWRRLCERCHRRLAFHGGQRNLVSVCLLCHTPERTDWETRPKDANHVTELAGPTTASRSRAST